jgi:hypothetical protein
VPALLLSGANDPVTPNEYGVRALRSFSNGIHLVVPGHGHGQLNNPCIQGIMRRFIDNASTAKLDTRCVDKQSAAPFMLTATTPGP